MRVDRVLCHADDHAQADTEAHAESGAHLKQLLSADHRYVFTLIHKFNTRDGAAYPKLSDRRDIIVITDEQSHDAVGEPKVDKAYMINVASSERAVGHGAWTRISGFSENVLSWIHESERMK